jgi:hypothetical protein
VCRQKKQLQPTAAHVLLLQEEEGAMKIVNHRFDDAAFEATPNQGGEMMPEYVIIHYTATQGKAGVVQAFRTPSAKVSAPCVIS